MLYSVPCQHTNVVADIFTFQWLVLRYAILNLEVIQAAIRLAKQEGLLVSLDLASFEVFFPTRIFLTNPQLVMVSCFCRQDVYQY